MTMRPIRLLGDPVLRTPCEPVTSFDAELRALVADLMDTLLGAPGRAGVAAAQIGVSARVFVYHAGGQRGHLVNPTLELSEETEEGDEGCLSLPGLSFPTPRATRATAHGFDQYGEPVTISGSGFLARALQHETDHLDGRLYVDRSRGDTRRQALRAVRGGARLGPHLHDDHLRVRVTQEVVVGDVPAVRAGAAEHQHVADPQPVHRLAAGQHVARRAQLTDRVHRDVRAPRAASNGYGQSSTGSTVNGWL